MTSGKSKDKTSEMEQLGWPQSCMYYDGTEPIMGHIYHKCKHPDNEHHCMPCSCPLMKDTEEE